MRNVLTYSGNLVSRIDRTRMLGPDAKGRYLTVKSVDYNDETDVTTVVYRPLQPDEYRERVMELVPEQAMRNHVRRLFNG